MTDRNSSAGQDNQDTGTDRDDELRTGTSDEAIDGNSAAEGQGADQPEAGSEGAKDTAGSPDADDKGAKERRTLLDAVRSAVEKPKKDGEAGEGSPDSESKDGSDKSGAAADAKDGNKDPKKAKDGQSDKDLPFHNHPRWQEMKRERDGYKDRADQYDKITTFCRDHGVSGAEAAEAITIMAAIKTDPRRALEALAPVVDQLRTALGETLPADLKGEVESGAISEDRAKELARARADKALADKRAEGASKRADEVSTRERETAEASRRAETAKACEAAVNAEEDKTRKTDLAYATKQPFIRSRMRELIAEAQAAGQPITTEKAVEIYRDALKHVTDNLKGLVRSQRPAVRHVPSGNSSPSSAASAPKTMFDAVKQSLNAA